MKNEERMLRAIGEIDDAYVLEGMRGDAKPSSKPGLKKLIGLVAVLALVVGIGSAGGVFNMGRKSESGYQASSNKPFTADLSSDISEGYGLNNKGYMYDMESPATASMEPESMSSYAESDYRATKEANSSVAAADKPISGESGTVIADQPSVNTKLIYSANISIQAVEYEKAVEDVKALTESFGGYIQSSHEYNGGLNSDGSYKNGSFTLRIPAASYRAFMNTIGENCHVVDCSEQVEDVSLHYSEMEGRLENMKIKQDRLQNLLRKADNMSDIIQIENELSNVEYMIESYASGLNRYDSLIGFSTISVNITKVSRIGEGVDQDPGFFARLGRAVKYGIENFIDGFEGLVIDLAYGLPWLLLTAAVVWVIARSSIGRAVRRKIANAIARFEMR